MLRVGDDRAICVWMAPVAVIALWSFALFVPSTASAQFVSPYDPASEATFTGTVANISTGGPGRLGWLMRVHTFGLAHEGTRETQLLVKTDTETVQIHLGPAAFLSEKNVEIKEGDTLSVIGSRVTLGNARVVLAREVRKGDNVWTLRDTTGQPLWSSVATESRGFWSAGKVLLTVVAVKVALLFTVLRH